MENLLRSRWRQKYRDIIDKDVQFISKGIAENISDLVEDGRYIQRA
jgi:hypothetical protein